MGKPIYYCSSYFFLWSLYCFAYLLIFLYSFSLQSFHIFYFFYYSVIILPFVLLSLINLSFYSLKNHFMFLYTLSLRPFVWQKSIFMFIQSYLYVFLLTMFLYFLYFLYSTFPFCFLRFCTLSFFKDIYNFVINS